MPDVKETDKKEEGNPENPKEKLTPAEQRLYHNFLRIWISSQASILGSETVQFVIIWWLTIESKSSIILSLSMFLNFIWHILIPPFAGVLADRISRKKIMIFADFIQALITLFLIYIFYNNLASIIILLITNSMRSLFQSIHQPASGAIIPSMVPKEKLQQINSLNTLFNGIIMMFSPIFGAFLLGIFKVGDVLWIDIITFLIAFSFLVVTPVPHPKELASDSIDKKQPKQMSSQDIKGDGMRAPVILEEQVKRSETKLGFWMDFKEGIRTLFDIKGMGALLVLVLFINFLLAPIDVLLPLFITVDNSGTALEFGIAMASFQIGIIIGAVFTTIKKNFKKKIQSFSIGLIIVLVGPIIIGIAPYNGFYVVYLGAIITGFGIPVCNSIAMTIIQFMIPKEKIGRIMGLLNSLSMIIYPLGVFASGILAQFFSIPSIFIASAVIGIFLVIYMWLFKDIRVLEKGISNST
ncbi:MAG: MFS transporter [Promethearchaeota archaeon]